MRWDYFSLAFNNLRRRGMRSWLTMLGIFIGIAAVVSLISLGVGLQQAVLGQFSSLSVDKLTIQNANTGFGPPGSTVIEKLNLEDVEVIEQAEGIDEIFGRILRPAKVEYNKAAIFSFVASIPDERVHANIVYDSFGIDVKEGRLIYNEDFGKVVLGNDFVKNDYFDKDIRVGNEIKIADKDFEVEGILEKSSSFEINSAILMIERDTEELYGVDGEYDLIVVQVQDKDKIEEVAEEVEELMRRDRKLDEGDEDFSVQTPIESLEGVNLILNIIQLIVVGIALISLLVGGIGITNTMFTSVIERTKEIGVMKAIGAKNQDIMIIFLIESGLLGLVGGIVGAVIGLAMAMAISNAVGSLLGGISFGVRISYPLLFGAISFSFILGIISGTLPALQASRLNPVEALRK